VEASTPGNDLRFAVPRTGLGRRRREHLLLSFELRSDVIADTTHLLDDQKGERDSHESEPADKPGPAELSDSTLARTRAGASA
jgi:hypothetical protein